MSVFKFGRSLFFSALELLIAFAIMVLIIALLLPYMQKAQLDAQVTNCMGNLAQVYRMLDSYQIDWGGSYPLVPEASCEWGEQKGWMDVAKFSEGSEKFLKCPVEHNGNLFSYAINAREVFLNNDEKPGNWMVSDFVKGSVSPAKLIIVEESNRIYNDKGNCNKHNYTAPNNSFTISADFAPLNHGKYLTILFTDGHTDAVLQFIDGEMSYFTNNMSQWK